MACCGQMPIEDEFSDMLPEMQDATVYEVSVLGQIKPGGGLVRKASDVVEVKGGGGSFFRDSDGNLKTLPLVATAGAGAVAIGLLVRSMRGG